MMFAENKYFPKVQKCDIICIGVYLMSETELLIKKAETLPRALYQEAVHYIDYLSQKAHAAYVAEKLEEVKRDGKWLTEEEFWNEDD